MSYIIFVLIIMAVCLFVVSYKNKYTVFLAFMIISIVGMLFSMLNFVFKTGYYNYTMSSWGSLDYEFYLMLTWLRLQYYTIVRMFNISVAAYMLSVGTFMFFYFKSIFDISRKKFYKVVILFLAFPLYTIWFYEPVTSNMLYSAMYNDTSGVLRGVILTVDFMNYVLMFLYITAPIELVLKSMRHKTSFINKKRALSILVCLLVVNIYFISMILLGFFRKPYIINPYFAFIQPVNNNYSSELYVILTVVSIIVISVMLLVIEKFSMTGKIGFIKRIIFRKNLNTLDRNYINLFHSVKNIIYSYKFLVEKIRMTDGHEQKEAIDELNDKIDDYIKRISLMLNVINDNIEFEIEKTTLENVVNDCLEELNIDDKIEVSIIIKDSVPIEIDAFYMRDVLMNIIQNSIDAITKSENPENGRIIFEFMIDGEWSILKISDNGPGMDKKTRANLFKPFYTTKSRITNWGVGLSFSSKIIHYHGGYIYADSIVGKGTDMYLYLPTSSKYIRKRLNRRLI